MNLVKLDDARSTLSAGKQSLEAKRKALFEDQAAGFKRICSADQARAREVWGYGFIVLFALVCFVINAALSLGIFAILENTVYADTTYDAMSQSQQASMVTKLLTSTLILPTAGVVFALRTS